MDISTLIRGSDLSDTTHFVCYPINSTNTEKKGKIIPKRGDILLSKWGSDGLNGYSMKDDNGNLIGDPHVAIYLGNNKIADMCTNSHEYRANIRDVAITDDGYSEFDQILFEDVIRLVSLDGQNFDEIPDAPDVDDHGGGGGQHRGTIDLDKQNFKFNGMPTDVINAGTKSFQYYLDKIADAFDYLLGIILNGFKVIPLGITTGLENWITDILNSLNTKII